MSFCHSQPCSGFVWIVPQCLSRLSSLSSPHSQSHACMASDPTRLFLSTASFLFISRLPETETIDFHRGFISKVSQHCRCRVSGIQLRGRCEGAVGFTLVVCGMWSSHFVSTRKSLFQTCVASGSPAQAGPPFPETTLWISGFPGAALLLLWPSQLPSWGTRSQCAVGSWGWC